jgi:hypothetical protein
VIFPVLYSEKIYVIFYVLFSKIYVIFYTPRTIRILSEHPYFEIFEEREPSSPPPPPNSKLVHRTLNKIYKPVHRTLKRIYIQSTGLKIESIT